MFEEIATELKVELLTFRYGIALVERLRLPPPIPSIVFLDINIPGQTGINIVNMIRQNPDWRKIPIVMLTTSEAPESIERSYDAGATYYMVKQGDYETQKRALRDVIAREWKGFR